LKAVNQYLRHAEECEALARTAISEEQRQMIIKMAQTWRMLAKQRERHLLSKERIDAMDAGLAAAETKDASA
jgi:hypothetical protein